MPVYNKYLIRSNETFKEENFPKVQEELAALKEAAGFLPAAHRAEMIISYIKSHSLKTGFIEDNPRLAEMMSSNRQTTGHIEALFDSCKEHKTFLQDFEKHLNKELSLPPAIL